MMYYRVYGDSHSKEYPPAPIRNIHDPTKNFSELEYTEILLLANSFYNHEHFRFEPAVIPVHDDQGRLSHYIPHQVLKHPVRCEKCVLEQTINMINNNFKSPNFE